MSTPLNERLKELAKTPAPDQGTKNRPTCYTQTPARTRCGHSDQKGHECKRPLGHSGEHDDFLGYTWACCGRVQRRHGIPCQKVKGHGGKHANLNVEWED